MTAVPGKPGDAQPGRLERLALCAGLLFAFSPALAELARHMGENPWARYAALFPFLFARSARARHPGRTLPLGGGLVWIGLGMVVELLGILAGIPRIGRLGLVLAAVGLCRRFGWAGWPEWPLLVLAIPVPSAALQLASPAVEIALASAASTCLDRLGLAGIEVVGGAVRYGTQELVLEPFDTGLALAPLLAGISWYGSVLRKLPFKRALLRATGAGLLAFPAQLAAIAFALLSLPLGAASVGRWALSELPWMLTASIALAAIEWRLRGGGTPHAI